MQGNSFGFTEENPGQSEKQKHSSSKEKGKESPENIQKELRKMLEGNGQMDLQKFQKLFQEALDISLSNDGESHHSINNKEEEPKFDIKDKIKQNLQVNDQPIQEPSHISPQKENKSYQIGIDSPTNLFKKVEQGADSGKNKTKEGKISYEEEKLNNLKDKGPIDPMKELLKKKIQELEKRNKDLDQEYNLLQHKIDIQSSLELSQINMNNTPSQNSLNTNNILEEGQLNIQPSSIGSLDAEIRNEEKKDLINEALQIDDLRKSKRSENKTIYELEKLKEDYIKEIVFLSTEKDKLNEFNSSRKKENEELHQKLQEIGNLYEKVKTECDALITRKNSMSKNMPQNQNNNNNIVNQKTDLVHEMFEASEKLIARLEKEKEALEKKYNDLYEKCSHLQKANLILNQERKKKQETNSNILKENEILKSKLETLHSIQDALQKFNFEFINNNKYFGQSVQILEEKLRTSEKTIEKLQSEKETLEVKLKSLELVKYDEIKKNTWQIEEYSNEIIRNLKMENKELKEKNDDLMAVYKELLETKFQFQDSFERFAIIGQKSIEKVLNEKEQLQVKYQELLIKYDELDKQISKKENLSIQNEKNQEDIVERETKKAETVSNYESNLKNENEVLKAKYDRLKANQEILIANKLELQNSFGILSKTFQSTLQKLQNEKKEIEKKYEEICVKSDDIYKNSLQTEENKSKFMETISQLQEENEQLKANQEKLEKENSQLHSKNKDLDEKIKTVELNQQKIEDILKQNKKQIGLAN